MFIDRSESGGVAAALQMPVMLKRVQARKAQHHLECAANGGALAFVGAGLNGQTPRTGVSRVNDWAV